MRIVYLTSTFTIHDYRFLSKLVSTKHSICLIDFFNPKYDRRPRVHENIINLPGLKVYTYDRKFEIDKRGILYDLLKVLLRTKFLKEKIREIRPDIVHSGWIPSDSLYAVLAGFQPVLAMTWGSDVLIYPKEAWWKFFLTRFVLKRADMVYCDSETVREEVLRISNCRPEKTVVFPQPGIDLTKFNPPDDSEKNRIKRDFGLDGKKILLMTRNLEPIYGVQYFIKALPLVVKHHPQAHAVIAGDGTESAFLKKLVSELGIWENMTFTGFVENENLPAYYKMADVYVSSSLSDGTSLSLLEAMSCGLPVVVSDVPSNLEWIKDGYNGRVIPRKSINELSKTVIDLLGNADKMKEVGNINISIARNKICIERNFSRLLNVYKKLVDNEKGRG